MGSGVTVSDFAEEEITGAALTTARAKADTAAKRNLRQVTNIVFDSSKVAGEVAAERKSGGRRTTAPSMTLLSNPYGQ